MPSLRDRKRARTRQALVDAAAELFERKGYERTTVADIAAAAEIATRTFFGYFASKDEVLFADGDARVIAALRAIDDRGPHEGPTDVLLRGLREVAAADDDLVGPRAALRLRLIRTVPAVRGRALQVLQDAQLQIARRLSATFPTELDEVEAAALVGAFVGAVNGALQVLYAEGVDDSVDLELMRQRLHRATTVALQSWSRPGGRSDFREPLSR
jgi:AcrR family transcriptional regulator